MNKQRLTQWVLLSLSIMLLLSAACLPEEQDEEPEVPDPPLPTAVFTVEPPTPTPDLPTPTPALDVGNEMIVQEANVESVTATVVSADLVDVTISGTFPDGCTSIGEVESELTNDTFMVTVMTQRPADLACTLAIEPFEHTLTLDVGTVPPGIYTINVNGVTTTVDLSDTTDVDSDLVSIVPTSGPAGTAVTLTAVQLPANTTVEIGTGLVASEFDLIDTAVTTDAGSLEMQVAIPEFAEPGEAWVFVVVDDRNKYVSEPFLVMDEEDDGDGALFDDSMIFLVALEDGGQSGEEIGCGDSLIPVVVTFEPTIAPLTAVLEQLLEIDEEFYGQSGLYNALHQSDLIVEGIDIEDRTAIINLSGTFAISGVCDAPRVEAQLTQTALQYDTIDAVDISINGTPLEELLSGQ